ncbi:MAG TPA: GldG family protein, partial [Mariprofundaceae bacterium]|nr:GldG family protein [Mariprofundaceae bacterium]
MDEMVNRQDNRRAVRTRTWMTLLAVMTVALLLFLATSLSHLHSDWTEGQIYTLSDSSLSVVEQLEEPILIRAYITSGLPQPYGRLKMFIEDMLRAYHEAGGGNLGYEVIDPSGDANLSAALNAMKIPKVQVQVVEDDQAQVKQGYLAIVIEYLDNKEIIPVVQSEEGFEYLLTRKIKKLTGKGRSKIGILSGFGAAGPYQLRRLQELVRDDYELVEVDGEKG